MVAAGVLVLLVVNGIDLSATAGVVAAAWLAAHQVPVTIGGSTLGVLPLLPTLVLGWATERSVAGTGVSGRGCAAVLLAAVVGPVLVAVAAIGVISTSAGGLPLTSPDPAQALAWVVVVHLLGAVVGLAGPSGWLAVLRRALPGWAWLGVVQVPKVVATLVAAGSVLTTLALVWSYSTAAGLIGAGGGAGGALGLVLLSTAYLPNVAVGAASMTIGPGAVLGQSTLTPFGAVNGPVPPLPVLAVLPEGSGSWWWPVVLVVPATVAALLGWQLTRTGAGGHEAVWSVLTASVLSGVAMGGIGAASGGSLGSGVFTPVGVPVLALAAATVGWLSIVGSVTVLVLKWRTDPAGAVDGAGSGAEPEPDGAEPEGAAEPEPVAEPGGAEPEPGGAEPEPEPGGAGSGAEPEPDGAEPEPVAEPDTVARGSTTDLADTGDHPHG